MGFVVNTNTTAMVATTQSNINKKGLSSSLEKLSSGLKINRAADDASGLAIADSLRSQANSLHQAYNNANEAVGIIQIADQAMVLYPDLPTQQYALFRHSCGRRSYIPCLMVQAARLKPPRLSK